MEVVTIKYKFLRNLFDQNTYVLKNENEAIIIDAGADVDDVEREVQGLNVLAILITHIHFDHVWNLEEYIKKFDTNIYISSGQENRFSNSRLNASFMLHNDFRIDMTNAKIKHYDGTLHLGSFDIEIIETPGHTKDGVSLLIDGNLFSGDTLFNGNIGRTDLDDSSEIEMAESLKKLKETEFDVLYPGHFKSCFREEALKTIESFLNY